MNRDNRRSVETCHLYHSHVSNALCPNRQLGVLVSSQSLACAIKANGIMNSEGRGEWHWLSCRVRFPPSGFEICDGRLNVTFEKPWPIKTGQKVAQATAYQQSTFIEPKNRAEKLKFRLSPTLLEMWGKNATRNPFSNIKGELRIIIVA